ncbi:bifunctional adenosylcobinamide kinase/adenosylcobinamide-phosphate guanylyltransferase [Clostridium sp.]
MLYIVTGGSGSGKSEYAEQIAVQCRNRNGGTLWYLATMRIWDDEGRKRVERHRRMRAAKGFETIERYTGLETLELREKFEEPNPAGLDAERKTDSLKHWESCQVAQKPVLLLECMSNLVLNEFYDQKNGAEERILQGIKHLQKQCRDLIIVTNEIFSDGVTYDSESERYIELLGRINRELGQMADSVTEVVYGIPLAVSTPVFAADERTKDVG